MAEISMKTAALVWKAHKEIENGEKLLKEMRELNRDGEGPTPRDEWGRRHRDYQFGVPSGEDSHRLLGVSPKLAVYVVEAHIADMKQQLAKACVVARMELDGVVATETV